MLGSATRVNPSQSAEERAYYDHMTKAILIEHCTAYSQAIHEMAREIMELRYVIWKRKEAK